MAPGPLFPLWTEMYTEIHVTRKNAAGWTI
jgi:hypothetical protein